MEAKKTITINGRDYEIRSSLRSLFLFEEITKRPFRVETLLDNYLYFYCVLLACNKDVDLTWNEFIDAIDADPGIFEKMNESLAKADEIGSLMESGQEEEPGKEDQEKAQKKSRK